MHCASCGTHLRDDARFCSQCGTPATPDKPKACSCGAPLEDGARFCGSCGSPASTQLSLNHQFAAPATDNSGTRGQAKSVKHYMGKAHLMMSTADVVARHLESKNLSVQVIPGSTECVVQARQEDRLKKFLAMDVAATITFQATGDDLRVSMGAGKWLDKAAGAAVAYFLFWPAILTTGWGVYMQQQLFTSVDKVIQSYLSTY